MSQCGDYEDITFYINKRVLWYSNNCLLFALKKNHPVDIIKIIPPQKRSNSRPLDDLF